MTKPRAMLYSPNLGVKFHVSKLEEEQGWRSGESARLPPMCPGFDSRPRRHMWVEFVLGSLPCSERFFSGYSGFPLSSKTNISKFQFDQALNHEPLARVIAQALPVFDIKFAPFHIRQYNYSFITLVPRALCSHCRAEK